MRFEAQLAWRYLTSSPSQTLLSMGAVTAAVCIVIFINSLLLGMRNRIADDFIGSISHIDLTPLELESEVINKEMDGVIRVARYSQQYLTQQTIARPERVQETLEAYPEISSSARVVSGQGFLVKGRRQFSLTIKAAQPNEYDAISGLESELVAGRWRGLGPSEMMLGYILAEELGLNLHDRITIRSSEGISDSFTVVGLYDTGNDQQDRQIGYLSLRAGQRLFSTGNDVNSIAIRLHDPWSADETADSLRTALPYKVRSWLDEQVRIKNMIGTQDAARLLLSGFSLLTSTFAIAAVLIVSVRGRTRQIGILKSMGASDAFIIRVFTLQGLFLALLGAGAGALSGMALLHHIQGFVLTERFGSTVPLMPVKIQPSIILTAVAVAILCTLSAATLPALQAAKVNPVEAING